jgi:hypothetical protein
MNDQVKTADGYNFGGTSYKNEERTNSQGQKYSVAIPISSVVSQAPQPQFQTPVQQAPTDYNSMTTDIATPYDIAVQQQQQNQLNAPADITNLMNTIAGKSAFEAQQNEATGLNTANQEAIRKAAEISALGKQAAAAQQENISQGRQLGSVSSFVAGQGAEIERNRAIKALSLGAELDAIQGNIAVAQSKVKQAVDAQYAGKELALANKLKMFELNQSILGNLTSQQQKAFEQAKYKVEQEQKRLTEEKRSKEDIQNMIIEATPNAPANIVANAKKLAESGASKLAVAQALGVYGGDYLKNELLKEQIKTQVSNRATDELQRKKILAEISNIDTKTSNLTPQKTGVVTAPNGDAIGIPTETLSAIGRLKLNEGQANAVAFTSRMIQSAKALDSQLGAINPNGGFYETSGYDPTSAGSSIGRMVGSDQSRVYTTNSADFIRAKLRKESGATITDEEMSADSRIYTPSGAGLDEKDLKLAQIKRDEAIKSMIAQAGAAALYLQQYYEQSKTQGDIFMSENPQLNEWYKNTKSAIQTSTAQVSTGGGTYGFSDNQK